MAIKVLLCDQQTILRSGLRALLERESDIEVVGEAGDGLQAVAMTRRLRPAVVIMDVPLPKLDGIQATWQLTGSGIAEPAGVIILTAAEDDETVIAALRAGARAFLLKGDPASELIHAVRVVAAGGAVIAPLVARRLLDQFAGSLRHPRLRPPPAVGSLTGREIEVLELIAQGRTNAEIAEALSLSQATIKSHAHHLMRKLDLKDRAQVVVLAYRTGMVQPCTGEVSRPVAQPRTAEEQARPASGRESSP